MKKITQTLAMLLALATPQAWSYILILDMDVTTAPGPPPPGPLPGPPGPGTGFEPTLAVTSGSTVTVIAYIVSTTGASPAFDSIGIDISYGLPGDTATIGAPGPPLAGTFAAAGAGGFSSDLAVPIPPGAPVGPGGPLIPLGLALTLPRSSRKYRRSRIC